MINSCTEPGGRLARRRHLAIVACLLLAGSPAHAQGNDLPAASDLRAAAAQAARQGGPLVVIYSRRDCQYCETVKRDYLKPLASHPRYRGQLVIRQVNQDADLPLADFHGETTTHDRFAAREKIKLVPVVAFYGPNGQRLAEPIVGARLPDFYQSYLEAAIEHSIATLKAR